MRISTVALPAMSIASSVGRARRTFRYKTLINSRYQSISKLRARSVLTCRQTLIARADEVIE